MRPVCPSSLEACHNTGYDIARWLEEDLMDLLVPAANAETDPAIDVAGWQALCRPYGVPVYPGFDGSVPNASIWQGGCVGPEQMDLKNELTTRSVLRMQHKLHSQQARLHRPLVPAVAVSG
eukprot:SAG22_NODE_7_length_40155_cov_25.241356_21_plen_121_part_00